MNIETAEKTSLVVLHVNSLLNSRLAELQGELDVEEFTSVRRLFAGSMAALLNIVNPIYRAHPQLRPAEMGGSYSVPTWVFEGPGSADGKV